MTVGRSSGRRLPEAGNRESARRAGTPHSADRIQPVQPEAADPAMVQLCEAGDVLPVYLPVLFDVEAQQANGVECHSL